MNDWLEFYSSRHGVGSMVPQEFYSIRASEIVGVSPFWETDTTIYTRGGTTFNVSASVEIVKKKMKEAAIGEVGEK